MSAFWLEEYDMGFSWGPMEVERTTSDPKYGVVLTIWSRKQEVEIRVTPSGFIRLKSVQPVKGWRLQ